MVFQASSDFEAYDIRRTLGHNDDIQVTENIGAQEIVEKLSVRTTCQLKAVFVSRISPMNNLLAALKMLQKVQHPLVYDIYGPIEDKDYWAECEKVIAGLPSHIHAHYQGSLSSIDVVKTLEQYDVFFLPTKGENYCHVSAEELCAGFPF